MAGQEPLDLVIIGGGPAGLSAAINAASERMSTLALDSGDQFGGQAGTSTLIENYPGFSDGVTRKDLASNMIGQALKFNVQLQAPLRATGLEPVEGSIIIHDDSEGYMGRAVLVGCGVQYRVHTGR